MRVRACARSPSLASRPATSALRSAASRRNMPAPHPTSMHRHRQRQPEPVARRPVLRNWRRHAQLRRCACMYCDETRSENRTHPGPGGQRLGAATTVYGEVQANDSGLCSWPRWQAQRSHRVRARRPGSGGQGAGSAKRSVQTLDAAACDASVAAIPAAVPGLPIGLSTAEAIDHDPFARPYDQASAHAGLRSVNLSEHESEQTYSGVVHINGCTRSTVEHELALRPGFSPQTRMPPTAQPAPQGVRLGLLVLTAGPVRRF
jgi:hypothetical protein